ncbi:hypothetical protein BV25DRAFT_1863869 [Artomyces pyxidatus]|uniref:Uncharacterized protein n=1 Tax=Artomyces pyxidatus TaxID=48021 RepID=A0ACB8SME7_9AGAM|nr:hypothetical protein BV25DRAFT_1863869 [Artomyces pyxidatus]
MPTFDIVVVGSGGGPFETNLSAYLLKPCNAPWKDGVLALEAGSGIGTLHELIRRDPTLFDTTTHTDSCQPRLSARDIYSYIRGFLITHGHLDHVNGLVLSAGSLHGPRKHVYAAHHTLLDLETIFSDRVWPNLASWDANDDAFKLLYDQLSFAPTYRTIFPDVSVRMMPLQHGKSVGKAGVYESAAFFVRYDPTGRQFLFFGDVEPDSIAPQPRTRDVWRAAAAMVPHTLDTVFIECSWPSGRKDEHLYGHLSPEHLADELSALAKEVFPYRNRQAKLNGDTHTRKKRRTKTLSPEEQCRGALNGLRVYIMHCKDDLENAFDRPIQQVIGDQVRALVEKRGLGAEILSAEQGMRIVI